MSKADLERFVSDLKADANLQSEVKAKATGIPSLVKVATARGYEITAEDIRQYARSQGQELTDEQLESIAGGRVELPIVVIVPTIVVIIRPF
jgi:predicted ribosomally synthesized peptide with nif11-like leader